MHRIVYTSTANWHLKPVELEDLLLRSQRHNSRDDVTGILIYHDGCFFQVLEGPEGATRACFERISHDRRHTGTIVLADEAVSGRLFSAWRMACRTFEGLTPVQQRQFVDLKLFADAISTGAVMDDAPKMKVILMAFLSGFRDLDLNAA